MKSTAVTLTLPGLLLSSIAFAQATAGQGTTQSATPPSNTASVTQPTVAPKQSRLSRPANDGSRNDALYPKPSGQDSSPNPSPPSSHSPAAQQQQANKAPRSKQAASGTQSSNPGKSASYTGATGKKSDPGTACSTARRTADGRLDCGTGGNGATAGKIVTK
jgi:hypothetical protein